MTVKELKDKIRLKQDLYAIVYQAYDESIGITEAVEQILELPEIKEALELREKLLLGWNLLPRKL